MKHLLTAALIAATTLAGATSAPANTKIKVMVVQEDWDPDSLAQDNRVRSAVLNTFNAERKAQTCRSHLECQGIERMDIYDETSPTLEFYAQGRRRRTDKELMALARTVSNHRLDMVVPCTLFSRAVDYPHTGGRVLQFSLSYRALSLRDLRYLGCAQTALGAFGMTLTGCAAERTGVAGDTRCINDLMARHGSLLAGSAANKLALQLAAHLDNVTPAPAQAIDMPAKAPWRSAWVSGVV